MRLIHTSDWHLGHKLHGQNRTEEHQSFLQWLTQQIVDHQIDLLLITGDIFDTPNPSAQATQLFYDFLHQTHQQSPKLQVVIIGGNHDSARRLEAPKTLLKDLNVNIVGGLSPKEAIDFQRVYIPIRDQAGQVAAWVLAIPYLRPSDLPNHTPKPENYLIEGVREVYQKALDGLNQIRTSQQGLIITGHCYMSQGVMSEDSERKILGNHQNALPLDLFPQDTSYVALGHLHLAQKLAGQESVRYSGSPIPLSLTERHYQHQVVLVTLEGNQFISAEPLYVPRLVDMIRIPDHQGGVGLKQALEEIKTLPVLDEDVPNWQRPFLHICIDLKYPEPNLKRDIMSALRGKHPRLTKIKINRPKQGDAYLKTHLEVKQLEDLNHEEVFKLCWNRKWPDSDLKDHVLEAFQTLYLEVMESQQEEDMDM